MTNQPDASQQGMPKPTHALKPWHNALMYAFLTGVFTNVIALLILLGVRAVGLAGVTWVGGAYSLVAVPAIVYAVGYMMSISQIPPAQSTVRTLRLSTAIFVLLALVGRMALGPKRLDVFVDVGVLVSVAAFYAATHYGFEYLRKYGGGKDTCLSSAEQKEIARRILNEEKDRRGMPSSK